MAIPPFQTGFRHLFFLRERANMCCFVMADVGFLAHQIMVGEDLARLDIAFFC